MMGRFTIQQDGEVTLFSKQKMMESNAVAGKGNVNHAFCQLERACGMVDGKGCSPGEALRIFRKYVPVVMDNYRILQEVNTAAMKETDRAVNATTQKKNKRWTPEEDDALVNLAAEPENTTMRIAVTMGRTPGAVQTRISQLVGIGRISQAVAGRFIGTIDGEYAECTIDGEVMKVTK